MKNRPDLFHLTRRELLAGATGLGVLNTLQKRGYAAVSQANAVTKNSARAVILINLQGAPSHIDTFDVKDAGWNPSDLNIQQGPGGIALSQTLFPNLLSMSNDLLLLRNTQSWEAVHERGQFYLQTAHPANPAFLAESPNIGSVIALEKAGQGPLPPFLALNGNPDQGAKFLGGLREPFSAPASASGLSTLQHPYYGNQSQAHFESRYKLLLDLDSGLRNNSYDLLMANHASYYSSAKTLMYNQQIIDVFQFNDTDNQRYGNTNFGRACIVARNAIRSKAGTVFIQINLGGWDMHQNMWNRAYTPNMYDMCSQLDGGVGHLATDLRSSGDLNNTLILMLGEFGRSPGELNVSGGRDHHKDAMSVAMLGGGVKGGRVLGATDPTGAAIVDYGWSQNRPVFIEDITATLYSALGIDWTKGITDTPSGRKYEYVQGSSDSQFTAINEVFG